MADGEMDDSQVATLIPCSACGREISSDADTCPGCGNVNTWLHPRLEAVIAHLDQLDRITEFDALGHKMHLWTTVRNARQQIGLYMLIGSPVLLLISVFSAGFLAPAFIMLLVGMILTAGGLSAATTYELSIDIRQPGKIVGHYDRVFWADVIKIVRSK